jgi:hypothetical protein
MASSGNGDVEVGSTKVGDEVTSNNSGASNVTNPSPTSTTTGSSKLDSSSGARGEPDSSSSPTNYLGVIDESVQPLKIPPSQRSEDFKKLIQYGLDIKVAAKLDDIYNTGTTRVTTSFLILGH